MTYQISGRMGKGPQFTAGIVTTMSIVTRAAPILRYMRGWPIEKVREHCQEKGWTLHQAGDVHVD